ncbi:MAG: hypothetical protein WCK31_05175, partial [bacterium]
DIASDLLYDDTANAYFLEGATTTRFTNDYIINAITNRHSDAKVRDFEQVFGALKFQRKSITSKTAFNGVTAEITLSYSPREQHLPFNLPDILSFKLIFNEQSKAASSKLFDIYMKENHRSRSRDNRSQNNNFGSNQSGNKAKEDPKKQQEARENSGSRWSKQANREPKSKRNDSDHQQYEQQNNDGSSNSDQHNTGQSETKNESSSQETSTGPTTIRDEQDVFKYFGITTEELKTFNSLERLIELMESKRKEIMKKNHPDVFQGSKAEKKANLEYVQNINSIYDTLVKNKRSRNVLSDYMSGIHVRFGNSKFDKN